MTREITRPVSLSPLITRRKPSIAFAFEPTAEERAVMAERLGLLGLNDFRISGSCAPGPQAGWFLLAGRLEAEPVQTCVITLDPVTNALKTGFDLLLVPEDEVIEDGDPGTECEFYQDEMFDLAEIASVELALALDPYPKKPGVTMEGVGPAAPGVAVMTEKEYQSSQTNDRRNPFSALAALQKKE